MTRPDGRPLSPGAARRDTARRRVLEFARARLADRRQRGQAGGLVAADYHSGLPQLAFFREQIAPILERGDRRIAAALEIGSGLGWQCALMAAWGTPRVLGIDPDLARTAQPHGAANAHTLFRLAQREPRLREAAQFIRGDDGTLTSVRFPDRLLLAAADGARLPVPAGSFDLVVCRDVLEHAADPAGLLDEAARALRLGGVLIASAQPLYCSIYGHHFEDIMPLPWGHILWTAEELCQVIMAEAGKDRRIADGVPLTRGFLFDLLTRQLNRATPAQLRRALRRGPWRITGWVDIVDPRDEALLKELGVREATDLPLDCLLLRGLIMRLERVPRPHGLRLPMRMSFLARRRLRRIVTPWRSREGFSTLG